MDGNITNIAYIFRPRILAINFVSNVSMLKTNCQHYQHKTNGRRQAPACYQLKTPANIANIAHARRPHFKN